MNGKDPSPYETPDEHDYVSKVAAELARMEYAISKLREALDIYIDRPKRRSEDAVNSMDERVVSS